MQTTLIGGIISIFLNIFMFVFVISKLHNVVVRSDNTISTSESKLGNGEVMDPVSFEDGRYAP